MLASQQILSCLVPAVGGGDRTEVLVVTGREIANLGTASSTCNEASTHAAASPRSYMVGCGRRVVVAGRGADSRDARAGVLTQRRPGWRLLARAPSSGASPG